MKKISDEQLDKITANLVSSIGSGNETLDKIADSPFLLKKIQNNIAARKSDSRKFGFRWLIPAFAGFSILFFFGLFFLMLENRTEEVSQNPIEQISVNTPTISEEIQKQPTENYNFSDENQPSNSAKSLADKKIPTLKKVFDVKKPKIETKNIVVKKINPKPKNSVKKDLQTTEYKTDFIALSYLPAPENGQIVRVKVPKAMMISLGVTNNVAKNNETVNAEVVVDEYGTSRAIRFISDK